MKKDLDTALRAVFSIAGVPKKQQQKAISGLSIALLSARDQQAGTHSNKEMEYLKQADWQKYGEELGQLHQILQSMAGNKKKPPVGV